MIRLSEVAFAIHSFERGSEEGGFSEWQNI